MGAYIQIFCRSVIIFVFILSFAGKVRHIGVFQQTITAFALLPRQLSKPAALLFLSVEALIVVFVVLAGPLLLPGYLLAIALLSLFSAALLSVLLRRISTTCSCFGSTSTPVSSVAIARATGFIACSLGGCLTLAAPMGIASLNLAAWIPCALCALVFVGIWTQLDEIVRLFR